MDRFRSLHFTGDSLVLLDQTLLPTEIRYIECRTVDDVARAISEMKVRGAPAIGATAAYGMVLAAKEVADLLHSGSPGGGSPADQGGAPLDNQRNRERDGQGDVLLNSVFAEMAQRLRSTRPTAVNLNWAIDIMLAEAKRLQASGAVIGSEEFVTGMRRTADRIADDDIAINRRIGANGATLLRSGMTVMTHCNTGSLATVGYGTALGIIRAAVDQGKRLRVYADETRPYLQGSRLTAFELVSEGIDVTINVDSAAGYLMRLGRIDVVIVGADRIAANGDVANKIGTYSLACLARRHGIPFYVAAPTSSIDLSLSTGAEIPIEERSADEVTHFHGVRVAAEGVKVFNPGFDVTPGSLVSAIITEVGVLYPPYDESLSSIASMPRTLDS